MASTVPAIGAWISVSIFIASVTRTGSPAATFEPFCTSTSITVPGIDAVTSPGLVARGRWLPLTPPFSTAARLPRSFNFSASNFGQVENVVYPIRPLGVITDPIEVSSDMIDEENPL